MIQITLNDLTTLLGFIFGLSGLILGILNYLRDNPKIIIDLQWDLRPVNLPQYDLNEKVGAIRVSNVGRRPIYVSHVALRIPKGFEGIHLINQDIYQGRSISEGEEPWIINIPQNELEKYSSKWKFVRAQISDSTDKVWYLKKLNEKEKPSWAEES